MTALRLFDRLAPLLRWCGDAVRYRQWRRLLALSFTLAVGAVILAGELGAFFCVAEVELASLQPNVTALTLQAPATIAAGATAHRYDYGAATGFRHARLILTVRFTPAAGEAL